MAQRGGMYGRPENTPIEQPITPRPSPDGLGWYAPPAYSPATTSSSCALANHSYTPPPPNIGSSIACLRLKAQEYSTVMHNPYAHQMTQWLGRGDAGDMTSYESLRDASMYDHVGQQTDFLKKEYHVWSWEYRNLLTKSGHSIGRHYSCTFE